MTAGRLRVGLVPTLLALAAGLTACGQGTAARDPKIQSLPLLAGAKVVAQVRRCDRGARAFCAQELVVVDPRYKTSEGLLSGEHRRLRQLRWTGTNGDITDEHAAESPGHKLRVTYATAASDLTGIDLGLIQRSRSTALALSRTMYARLAAISVMLEAGPA
jgi:hypothetical protein